MAIMAIYDGEGFSRRNYDHVRAAIGWEVDPTPGCHMHLLGADANGLVDVQIWESEEQLHADMTGRLFPAFDALNLPRPPPPRVLELYNGVQSGEAERLVPLLATTLIPA